MYNHTPLPPNWNREQNQQHVQPFELYNMLGTPPSFRPLSCGPQQKIRRLGQLYHRPAS